MRSRWLAFVAVMGVVVAHAIDFVVVYRGDGERERQLASTGHGYWPAAVLVGLVTGLVALGWAAGRGGARGLADAPSRVTKGSVVEDVTRLAATQLVLFTVLESLERVLAGVGVAALLQSPEFLVGMVLQVVVAVLAVVALRAVERLSERVVRTAVTARRRAATRRLGRGPFARQLAAAVLASAAQPRAPPEPSLV